MSIVRSIAPAQPAAPRQWLLPDLLPRNDLVLLDGAAGVGKSRLASAFVALCSKAGKIDNPCLALYVTSAEQRELRDYHLNSQQPCHDRIKEAVFDSVAVKPDDFLRFIEENLQQNKPELLVIDSLEELLGPAMQSDYALFVGFWQTLRRLARDHRCCIVVPRQQGMHETRQYGAFTRSGCDLARFVLTMHWHPLDSNKRVVSIAKNLFGPMGQQVHLTFTGQGDTLLQRCDPYEHVRPARSPQTWQSIPRAEAVSDEIMNAAEELIGGMAIARDDLERLILKQGYSKKAFDRAMNKAKLPASQVNGVWYVLPTPAMTARAEQSQKNDALAFTRMVEDLNTPAKTARARDVSPRQDRCSEQTLAAAATAR